MKLIVSLVLSIAIIFFVFKYFQNSFTSGQPQDLGVRFSSVDYQQAHDKFGVKVGTISATSVKDSLVYSGKKDIKLSLSSAEVTSYINAETWKYSPLSQVQVKINPDGSAVASGIINLNNLLPYISLTVPVEKVEEVIKSFHLSGTPTFYVEGRVTVTDNQVSFDIKNLQIGRLPVPPKYVSENIQSVNNFATSRIKSVPNLQIRSLSLSSGQVNLDATVPEKVLKLEK